MTNVRLRLVHSQRNSMKAQRERAQWGFENAKQLSLFEGLNRIKICFVPVAELSPHSFMRALEDISPALMLDTRAFPDFFSVFVSVESALDEFQRRGIKYRQMPVQFPDSDESLWKTLENLRLLLLSYSKAHANAPIFVLSSTRSRLEGVSGWLRGCISQEIAEIEFQDIA